MFVIVPVNKAVVTEWVLFQFLYFGLEFPVFVYQCRMSRFEFGKLHSKFGGVYKFNRFIKDSDFRIKRSKESEHV